ncbi:hypothetical protein CVT25_011824 [Psilocybe cyanescens]|uniref:Major facilitator superfamily (MFS) profile domain-containing protein n=1 Tax=Psilocybe cyanescens TaxID=93625 RepID=A0A409WJ78_PSICY|nr:hypothetical protein CVT25_011824 [Psilocybe cyanescens]
MDQHTPLLTPINNPNKQLALLCAVRFIDPLTFTQIFPYINQFLTHLHVIKHQSQIGFYSGLVWARLSDNIGRRPVILVGIFGLAIATTFLGFATSLPAILLSRCLAGICSGIAAVLHAVLGELTNPTNQSTAFPIYGLFWPLGNIIGPLIGGALANPAEQFPGLFDYTFFKDYPYFLPCFITGLLAFIVGVLTALYLEETLPRKRTGRPVSLPYENCTSTVQNTSPQISSQVTFQPQLESITVEDASPPMSIAQLLRIPVIRALTFSGVALCFTATSFDALFVLFCYTPIRLGGLNFPASYIGYSLAIAGTSSILIQISCLPTLLIRVNHAKLYNICMFFWPAAYLALPLLNVIARRDIALGYNEQEVLSPSALYAVWILIMAIMIMSRIGCLAYSISLILVKQNAPSPSDLGKTNAIVLWGMCFAPAFAPAFVSSFFAASIDMHIFGGYLWLVIMVVISFAGCVVSLSIAHSEGYIDDDNPLANARLD